MSQIQFRCTGCGTTLGVPSSAAGKMAACPKCKAKSTIPAFEVVEDTPAQEEPEPTEKPPEKPLRFRCAKCGDKIEVSARLAGLAVPCPECGQRILVPEPDEVGTYTLGGKGAKGGASADKPLAAWWPDGKKLKLPSLWRANLEEALVEADAERWKKALALLHELQILGREDRVDIDILRKPLAYCLGGWARNELARIKENAVLSEPIRKLLNQVKAMQKWGGTFDTGKCAVCSRSLMHLVGTCQLKTTAGSAYICCVAPTAADVALIQQVQRVSKKLNLANTLDPESTQVSQAMAKLPQWYRAVDLTDPSWARRILDSSPRGGGEGPDLGDALDLLGNILGDILS
jgi:DNA-directed RNA polymerase subunit RPC12/RpoP